jgi:hypothetical protein
VREKHCTMADKQADKFKQIGHRSKEYIYSLEMSENDCFAIANC